MRVPVSDMNHSVEMCTTPPMPEEPKLSLPGFARARSTSSRTDFAGNCGLTTITTGEKPIRPTGETSFSGL